MRGFFLTIPLLIILVNSAFAVEKEEGEDFILFKGKNYALRLYKNVGTFDFLLVDRMGNLHPIHNPKGEAPWFGYNCSKGEIRSSESSPVILAIKNWKDGYEISLIYPLEEDSKFIGEFFLSDDFLVVRSLIKAKGERIGIVRLAPRFEVDIQLFNNFAFSIPNRIVFGNVKELGRPGYAGVRGWGGPKSYDSLDPACPFFALYNPDLKLGFLFIYPFYDKLWKDKHIFLQLWEGGINYLYAGWGDEKDLGKEVIFVISPFEGMSPEDLKSRAIELNKKIEEMVKKGDLPFPSFLNFLKMEERILKIWQLCEDFLKEKMIEIESASPKEFEKWKENIFALQRFFLSSRISFERGDYENSLLNAEKMLKILGIKEG